MKNELISCIKDFYKFEVNLLDAINLVVNGLKEMGLTIPDAIEHLIWTFGLTLPNFRKYIS